MENQRAIVFRDGATGRRAGLVAGADVWEVIAAVRAGGLEEHSALAISTELGSLTPAQVAVALRYHAEHRDEIDDRVRRNIEEAGAAEQRWHDEQDSSP